MKTPQNPELMIGKRVRNNLGMTGTITSVAFTSFFTSTPSRKHQPYVLWDTGLSLKNYPSIPWQSFWRQLRLL